ncbi:MAG: hypothetical protein PHN89_00570 [Candidatus Pacebacteria bacterium]|nr:hypothetical protein [Candidatus Paceibacterota bacterium]
MAIPAKATGAGNNNAQNVFKVTFDQALSTPPKIEAWDNSQAFPAKDAAGATTAKEIFTGTAGNGTKPMLYAVATTSSAPGANWKPASATAGSDNPNRMKGTTNYVTDPTTPGLGDAILFNLGLEAPYDATVPSSSSMAHMIQIRYTYTGTAPALTWAFNEGTEETPSWTTITPGTHGLQYCNSSTNWAAGPYKLTLPAASVVDAGEIGVTT